MTGVRITIITMAQASRLKHLHLKTQFGSESNIDPLDSLALRHLFQELG